jgi:dTDP-glucose 4,6-dehydratase
MRTLITGGAGFLGSHLCDRFLELGHEVICVDNLVTGSTKNIEHLFGREGFRFVRRSPVLEPEAYAELLHRLSFADQRVRQ